MLDALIGTCEELWTCLRSVRLMRGVRNSEGMRWSAIVAH